MLRIPRTIHPITEQVAHKWSHWDYVSGDVLDDIILNNNLTQCLSCEHYRGHTARGYIKCQAMDRPSTIGRLASDCWYRVVKR